MTGILIDGLEESQWARRWAAGARLRILSESDATCWPPCPRRALTLGCRLDNTSGAAPRQRPTPWHWTLGGSQCIADGTDGTTGTATAAGGTCPSCSAPGRSSDPRRTQ